MSRQAEVIADAILSRSTEGVATRIALMQKIGSESGEYYLGGLNRIALIDVIEEALTACAAPTPTDRGEK